MPGRVLGTWGGGSKKRKSPAFNGTLILVERQICQVMSALEKVTQDKRLRLEEHASRSPEK